VCSTLQATADDVISKKRGGSLRSSKTPSVIKTCLSIHTFIRGRNLREDFLMALGTINTIGFYDTFLSMKQLKPTLIGIFLHHDVTRGFFGFSGS